MEKEIKMVKYSLKKQKQAVRENKTKQNTQHKNDDAMRKQELDRVLQASPSSTRRQG